MQKANKIKNKIQGEARLGDAARKSQIKQLLKENLVINKSLKTGKVSSCHKKTKKYYEYTKYL